MTKGSIARFVGGLMLFLTASVFGLSGEDGATEDPQYIDGKKATANGHYQTAIGHLLKAKKTDPDNADVYNLLGYSYRKLEQNDLALSYYRKALDLDPKHRGAHEYIGALYLKLGNVSKAKEHLAQLDYLCFFGCEEYDELKQAIAAFEAEHN